MGLRNNDCDVAFFGGLDRARETLRRILAPHEPYPAMVVDRSWNMLMKNDASTWIVLHFLDEPAIAQLSSYADGRLLEQEQGQVA